MTLFTRPSTTAGRSLLLGLLLATSGCFGLNRGAPEPRHYVLDGGTVGADDPTERHAAGGSVVGLRPLRLAGYLASPLIVVRHGDHRVGYSEFHRWGADLARGVDGALARRLATRLPAHRIEPVPWPPSTRPTYLVQVELLRFEGVSPPDTLAASGAAHLLATWEILDAGDGEVRAAGTTDVRADGWTVGDFDGLVDLLDESLDTLVEDLALELDRLATAGEPGRR